MRNRRGVRFSDEEIDEDEAFGSEDEAEYGEILRRIDQNAGKNGKRGREGSEKIEDELRFGVDSADSDGNLSEGSLDDGEEDDKSIDQDDEKVQKIVDLVNSLSAEDAKTGRARLNPVRDETFDLRRADGEKGFGIQDLLASIRDEAGFGQLKSKYHKLLKGASRGNQIVEPRRSREANERLERRAAYAENKKEISKWVNVVKHNREAEHLVFPLHRPALNDTGNCSTLAAEHIPSNELEKSVSAALRSQKLRDNDIVEEENERLRNMTKEECTARIAELTKMRALIFYKNQRLKRISKIKSRTYRRHHRNKSKDGGSLPDSSMNSEDIEKKLYQRARERMSLRHKKSSTWRKRMISGDPETQGALREQNELHESLRENIEIDDESSSKSIDDNSSCAEDDDEVIEGAKKNLIELGQQEPEPPKLHLINMGFMRRAIQKDIEDVQRGVKDALIELDNISSSQNEPGDQSVTEEPSYIGRTFIGTKVGKSPIEMPQSDGHARSKNIPTSFTTNENPWLDSGSLQLVARSNRAVKCHNSRVSQKITNDRKLAKMEEMRRLPGNLSVRLSTLKSLSATADTSSDQGESTGFEPIKNGNDVQNGNEDIPPKLLTKSQVMQMVFAGDNLQNEFDDEKDECIREEGPKFEDTTLPGWGSSWSGPGIPERPPKPSAIKLVTPGKDCKDRKDFNIDNVIISEKKNKKFTEKYQVKNIPFGYGARDHYERLMRMPIGKDWNALSAHRNMVCPRIKILKGSVIEPIMMGSSMSKMYEQRMRSRARKLPAQKGVMSIVS